MTLMPVVHGESYTPATHPQHSCSCERRLQLRASHAAALLALTVSTMSISCILGKSVERVLDALRFAVGDWLAADGRDGFYEDVEIAFKATEPGSHYHVPLLVSPFGYSTYRGS